MPATNGSTSDTAGSAGSSSHGTGLRSFLRHALILAGQGNAMYHAFLFFLTCVILVGLNTWARQVAGGMIYTNMTDHVSWGLYIANFTFAVGVAAGGVMMVIPAYLYRERKMQNLVVFGEMLAIAAVVMAMLFVLVDLGRPDRFWHLIPGIGQLNWPLSMLSWDVIVLNGYLLLNLFLCGYLLYMRFQRCQPNPRYKWVVWVSIVWAFSIHTVTAFLFSGLGGRPLWNSALLAPRFLVSAFISGPALIILALIVVNRFRLLDIEERPIKILINILRITTIANLFMLASELFTEFYSGGSHIASSQYLFFGLDGSHLLVPWIWSAIGLNIGAAALLLLPSIGQHRTALAAACVMTFVGVWIEKGLGLVVPGFIPSSLFEIVEYLPSAVEWRVTAGIWAFGLLIYTLGIKIAVSIMRDQKYP